MTLLQIIALIESAIILVLAEPCLNRLSPCAPFLLRCAFHATAIGTALRAWHIIDGHDPSWSSVVQVGGIALLLVCDRLSIVRLIDRRKNSRT